MKPFAKVGRMLQFRRQSGACEGDWQNLLPRWGICYTSASKVELAKGIGETFLVALFVTFIFTCLYSLILVMIPQGGLLLATCYVCLHLHVQVCVCVCICAFMPSAMSAAVEIAIGARDGDFASED